ncbi:MAG TPA: DNA translocase FtsK 4TM domain-containing protein [Candidatus Saccharimonadia bacterium]|nr:DNA translocase FtsK 4TM domain-containing protein [Candidatus Saccharimonadia bacterium]
MPKKKKKLTKKDLRKETDEQSSFWQMAAAVLVIVFSLFTLIGGFGTGGSLPKTLYHGAYWMFGWGAWAAILAVIGFCAIQFKSDKAVKDSSKLIGLFFFIVFSCGWLFVTFAHKDIATNSYIAGHGGNVGSLVGRGIFSFLDKIPSAVLFFVLGLLMFFYTYSISPKVILKLGNIFKKSEDKEDTDLFSLKAKTENTEFKLNEGVPVEHNMLSPKPRFSSFKNSAQKMVSEGGSAALTTTNDPDWKFPSVDLLNQKEEKANAGDIKGNAQAIKDTFLNFNIPVDMAGANVGPTVTQYTLKPPNGVKLTKIIALENNLALDLAAHSIRIEAPIPGKKLVGIEVPNVKPALVRLSSVIKSPAWQETDSKLSFVIGKDISGAPVLADMSDMPHLMIAGQTGSGKSVMINTLLTSLLFRNTPSDLKLILIDPKQVELTPYNDIPHLLTPVIHDPEKTISALKWATAEMDKRLRAMAAVGRRNIAEYNSLKHDEPMPYIVIVIDELSDLMMVAARDVESLVVRLAQKARASGIHLVLATQRPSVDVITGLIKANVPARIAFTTASQVDSRTIIDQIGAEKLLNNGDMLLLTANMPKPKRIQAAFISDVETHKVIDFIKAQRPPQYNDEVISLPVHLNGRGGVVSEYGGEVDDDMWRDAVRVVIEGKKASTSLLQRRLRIGYGRAARLIEQMEEQGIVSSADGNRPREVLVSSYDEVFSSSNDEIEAPSSEGESPEN